MGKYALMSKSFYLLHDFQLDVYSLSTTLCCFLTYLFSGDMIARHKRGKKNIEIEESDHEYARGL